MLGHTNFCTQFTRNNIRRYLGLIRITDKHKELRRSLGAFYCIRKLISKKLISKKLMGEKLIRGIQVDPNTYMLELYSTWAKRKGLNQEAAG